MVVSPRIILLRSSGGKPKPKTDREKVPTADQNGGTKEENP
ncbi:hypothetical protein ABIA22_005369 [Sinorhizobium fredii]